MSLIEETEYRHNFSLCHQLAHSTKKCILEMQTKFKVKYLFMYTVKVNHLSMLITVKILLFIKRMDAGI